MLISHEHEFIFVKSGKVGGTSLEIALSGFMGQRDVITPLTWDDEVARLRLGYRTAQNFEQPLARLRPGAWPRWLRATAGSRWGGAEARLGARLRYPRRFWDHMPAAAIRERVPDDVWSRYYKFTVERNPWDKVVSKYYWDPKRRKRDLSFRDFVLSGKPLKSNFETYSINGRVAVDRVVRYDRMRAELDEVSERVGLPERLGEAMTRISAKGGYRKSREVAALYDEETRRIVEVFFAREIALMGFCFEDNPA